MQRPPQYAKLASNSSLEKTRVEKSGDFDITPSAPESRTTPPLGLGVPPFVIFCRIALHSRSFLFLYHRRAWSPSAVRGCQSLNTPRPLYSGSSPRSKDPVKQVLDYPGHTPRPHLLEDRLGLDLDLDPAIGLNFDLNVVSLRVI